MSGPARAPEPRRVEIHLGNRCNNLCVFCMSGVNRDLHEPWAPLERVREELRHFRERGCGAVGFLGGEPTVYPHIVECVAYAKELGYSRIAVCSNGTRMSNPDFCRRLADAGLSRVTLSVHSHRAEVEDGLATRVPGNLKRKLAAIDNLVALRRQGRLAHNVSLNPVLCRHNLDDLRAYVDFFAARGIDDIRFNYIWPEGEVGEDRSWVPSFREAMPRVVELMLVNEVRLKRRLTFGGIPKCALALAGVSGRVREHLAAKYLDEAGFDPDNDVTIATMRDRFVWQDVKKGRLKTKSAACAGCREDARCEGVWETYGRLYGLDELRPV